MNITFAGVGLYFRWKQNGEDDTEDGRVQTMRDMITDLKNKQHALEKMWWKMYLGSLGFALLLGCISYYNTLNVTEYVYDKS